MDSCTAHQRQHFDDLVIQIARTQFQYQINGMFGHNYR